MPKATTKKKSVYEVHPSVAMVKDWIERLPEKTGRSLDEWVQLVKSAGPTSEKEQRRWLKETYGLGTNSAWWIAERAAGKGLEDGDPETYLIAAEKYVEDMFAGSKTKLKPLYDALLKLAKSIGKEVKACPCKTIVPLYRKHVFAQIKPTTRTRIDFGFALKNTQPTKRLLSTGGFEKGDRITHRIEITSLTDIDDEVKQWLRKAYEMDV
ncbi:MAG: DUF5655 domain-containing protein [Acidobacteriota bacterium]